MNEREKRERASREREQEREEARAKPAREEKKSVLFSREREREREPSPLLFDGQLSFIVSSRARERRRAREELESSAWGERERERESRKRFSKLLFSSESGSSLEEISRLHKLTFFYLLLQKKTLKPNQKKQCRLRRGPPGRRLGPHRRVRCPPARIRRGRPVPRSRLQPLC